MEDNLTELEVSLVRQDEVINAAQQSLAKDLRSRVAISRQITMIKALIAYQSMIADGKDSSGALLAISKSNNFNVEQHVEFAFLAKDINSRHEK